MKKLKVFLLFILLFFIGYIIFPTISLYSPFKSSNSRVITKTDLPFGDVKIFNVTLEKTEVEVGKSIIINASYKLLLNEGWTVDSIYLGIINADKRLCKNEPKIQGANVKISDKFYFNPNDINTSLDYYGFLEIRISEIQNPWNYADIIKKSDEILIFTKAFVDCIFISQYPETIFSSDNTRVVFEFFNHNNYTFKYNNKLIFFKLENLRTTAQINSNATTDNNGIVNTSLDTSNIGCGDIKLTIYVHETFNYFDNLFYFQLYIYNDTTAFNFTILNKNNIYTNYNLNDTFSNVELTATSAFNASITCVSTFGIANFTKNKQNKYNLTLKAPKKSGTYLLNVSATPIKPGKRLIISREIKIKKRPLQIIFKHNRSKNSLIQFNFYFNLIDKLTNKTIVNQSVFLFQYNPDFDNWSKIDIIKISKINFRYNWKLPLGFNDSQIRFRVQLVNNSIFNSSNIDRTIIITKIIPYIKFYYPLSVRINLVFQFQLSNNSNLVNKLIFIKIGNQSWWLNTNKQGIINISYITPEKQGILKIEILYNNCYPYSPIYFEFNINIQRNLDQFLTYYSGYIIAFIILACFMMVTLKTFKRPKSLRFLKIR